MSTHASERFDSQRPTPTSGPGFPNPLNIRGLRHPQEYSRLVVALTATVVVLGAVVLFLLIAVPGSFVLVLWPYFLLLVALAAVLWLWLAVHRARLLGNSLRVTPEALPILDSIIEDVRARLDYRGRIDFYVSEQASEPVALWNFMGTRIVVLEGSMVADLQEEGNRPQLHFLLGSVLGTLKSRHQRFTLVLVLLEFQKNLRFLNLFLAPYFRATVYSGDQIGAACCNDVRSSVALMNRLLVGAELAPSVAARGVLTQAASVNVRWLPRLMQMFMSTPHLTNRYLNLMAFIGKAYPDDTRAYLDSLDPSTRERLTMAIENSPHHRAGEASDRNIPVLVAGLVTLVALSFVAIEATQVRQVLLASSDRAVLTPETEPVPEEPEPEFEPVPEEPEPEPVPEEPEPEFEPVPEEPEPKPVPEEPEPEPSVLTAADVVLAAIPEEFRSTCEEVFPPEWSMSAVVAFDCYPDDLDSVTYIGYGSLADMDVAYQNVVPLTLPTGDCSKGAATTPYESFDTDVADTVGAGTLACFPADDGSTVFVWTSDQQILSVANDSSLTYAEMEAEWESLGPWAP